MSYIIQAISAPLDGTFGCINSIINQIRDVIVTDPRITIISENTPTNTERKSLELKYNSPDEGDLFHQVSLFVTGSSSPYKIGIGIRSAINPEIVLIIGDAGYAMANNPYFLHFISNENSIAVIWQESTVFRLLHRAIKLSSMPEFADCDGWIYGVIGNNLYANNSDAVVTLSLAAYSGKQDGKLLLYSGRFISGNSLLVGSSNNVVPSGSVVASGAYKDSAGVQNIVVGDTLYRD